MRLTRRARTSATSRTSKEFEVAMRVRSSANSRTPTEEGKDISDFEDSGTVVRNVLQSCKIQN